MIVSVCLLCLPLCVCVCVWGMASRENAYRGSNLQSHVMHLCPCVCTYIVCLGDLCTAKTDAVAHFVDTYIDFADDPISKAFKSAGGMCAFLFSDACCVYVFGSSKGKCNARV